jgi:uncharacterized protein (TIGR00661 family)
MTSVPRTVLYGICGEGLGHFSRAAFLVPQLLEAGHEVEIFSSGRVADLCDARFPKCRTHRIGGLRMRYRHNRLSTAGTILSYSRMAVWWVPSLLRVRRRGRACRPIGAISDYEPVVAWAAAAMRVPLIALDHQQVATECELGSALPKGLPGKLLRMSNRMTYLRPRLRIITSFFPAPLLRGHRGAERKVIGPVLRPEVVSRSASRGTHVLVYQTSRSLGWLHRILAALPGEKRVYGAGETQSGHSERPFDEEAFIDDLASCRFAVVNGGHTTISEALHFGKPLICLPVRGQAEQELNARLVADTGVGLEYRPEKGEVPDFADFLRQEEAISATIARSARPCGNDDLLHTVLDRLTQWSQVM